MIGYAFSEDLGMADLFAAHVFDAGTLFGVHALACSTPDSLKAGHQTGCHLEFAPALNSPLDLRAAIEPTPA